MTNVRMSAVLRECLRKAVHRPRPSGTAAGSLRDRHGWPVAVQCGAHRKGARDHPVLSGPNSVGRGVARSRFAPRIHYVRSRAERDSRRRTAASIRTPRSSSSSRTTRAPQIWCVGVQSMGGVCPLTRI